MSGGRRARAREYEDVMPTRDDNRNENKGENKGQRGGGRGFAGMDEDKQREIASKGGHAAHEKGTAHESVSYTHLTLPTICSV